MDNNTKMPDTNAATGHHAQSSDQSASESSLTTELAIDKAHKSIPGPNETFKQDRDRLMQQETDTSEQAAADEKQSSRPRPTSLLGGKLRFRGRDDDGPSDWWFASTAIPLIAATFAPMANMLSIAALVVYWRNKVTTDDPVLKYATSTGYRDPQWCLNLNGASLAVGFVGNIFLLCNFTRKIRYIIALPVTILLFYLASGILIGITVGMNVYDPPKANEVYSQGYWHAVIAACLYMLNAMLLMVNMLGYFLGHYPQQFDLNDEQRNLILQTMIFFVWLGGGAAVFAKTEPDWGYVNALYFCDVTLLTIGFGDYYGSTDLTRGLVFPYTVGGTIILGLMVSSIHKFAGELSKEKVVKKHIETRRVNTLSRAVTIPDLTPEYATTTSAIGYSISRPLEADQIQHDLDEKAREEKSRNRTIDFHTPRREEAPELDSEPSIGQFRFRQDPKEQRTLRSLTLERVTSLRHHIPVLLPNRSQKAILMRSEKDRFDQMRDIQHAAKRFKKWYALTMSVISFGLLWCVGAVVFWQVESTTQGLSYFEALYFCYVSLLTIGYGDLSPKSNAGKPFFILWSLVAVPTMTILISDLGDTAIGGFKRKVLEYGGLALLGKGRGWGLDWFSKRKEVIQRRLSMVGISHEKAPRLELGNASATGRRRLESDELDDELEETRIPKTIEELAQEELSESEIIKRLGYTLRRVADDLKHNHNKRYSYEEWVEFTRLIRFTKLDRRTIDSQDPSKQLEYDEALDGLIEWDWLDSNSPMTSEQPEAEWVMDRLLESLIRTFRKADLVEALASGGHSQRTYTDAMESGGTSARLMKPSPSRTRSGEESTTASGIKETTQSNPGGGQKARRDKHQHKRHYKPASGLHGRLSANINMHGESSRRRPKTKTRKSSDDTSVT